MKVIIRVWDLDKPHELHDGMPQTTILEYDNFKAPAVVGLGIPIERCKFEYECLIVHLDEYPARIDADSIFEIIHLLNEDRAQYYPQAYTLLDKDKGKGIILWTNPNIKVEV